jgi:hypothetical protein
MSAATKMTWAVKFTPVSKGRKTLGVYQEEPPIVEKGRVPRVSRLMALAMKFEGMIRDGVVKDYAELARLGRVTRARISRIMSLTNLAPDIQEAVLFLARVVRGGACEDAPPPFRCHDSRMAASTDALANAEVNHLVKSHLPLCRSTRLASG